MQLGLDNGISIRRNTYTESICELERFDSEFRKRLKCDFEICYWRKCWNIRNDILSILTERTQDQYEIPLSKENVEQIIELLESYNSDNFEDNGSCIWDWDDEKYPYSEKIQQDIERLKVLRTLMDEFDLYVYFYDSY